MLKDNKGDPMSEDKLKKEMHEIFGRNGIDMPIEVLEYLRKLSSVFFKFMHKGLFCDKCKRKLYEATEKE